MKPIYIPKKGEQAMEEKTCASCCEADVPRHQNSGYCAWKGVICVNDAACEHYIRGEWKERIRLRAQSEEVGNDKEA